jgi:hypothetical protein
LYRYNLFAALALARTAANITDRSPKVRLLRFPFIQPLHLPDYISYSIGLLLLLQHHPCNPALYAVSVRRPERLPPASFRFAIAHDTLALG